MREHVNLDEHLSRLAVERPEQPALICPRGSLSYARLEELSARCGAGLRAVGLQPGTRVVLMVRPGREFLILVFALLKVRAVMVLVDPGLGRAYLRRCLAEAAPQAFIGTPLAHLGRLLFRWASSTLRLLVTVGGIAPWGGVRFSSLIRASNRSQPESLPPARASQPAALVFTTGSTGPPKGVVYTHGMFAAQAEALKTGYGIHPGEIDLATFPLFALFDPALEMTTIFPRMDFTRPARVDPEEIVGAIQRHGVTHLFGSPALLDRVARHGEETGVRLPSLRRVLSAGAPVPAPVLRRFSGMLSPEADLHTPYGATEALPVSSIAWRELAGIGEPPPEGGVCVGRPLPGVEVAVIAITDRPLPEWSEELKLPPYQVGELVVRGANVSARYWERPESDRVAKIGAGQPGVRHRMGDLGYLDGEGRIWFCGRKTERVVTPEGTLFTVPVEEIFDRHPEVLRSALVGIGEPPHQRPVLCVERVRGGRMSRRALRRELLELASRADRSRPLDTVLFHPGFPVDVRHNAKIGRDRLAVWASRRVSRGSP